LIAEIADNLNVRQDVDETSASWSARVVYSAVGNLAYNCLWNYDDGVVETFGNQARLKKSEENRGVSVVYWTRFIRKAFYAYCSLCSRDVQALFPEKFDKLLDWIPADNSGEPIADERTNLSDTQSCAKGNWEETIKEILELYVSSGYFYHRPHWLAPACRRSVAIGSVVFERGTFWNGFVSGLGGWRQATTEETYSETLDALGLQKPSFASLFDEIQYTFKSENKFIQEQAEYLRVEPQNEKWGCYWLNQPTRDGEISLGRYGKFGLQRYFLYRASKKTMEIQCLPEWRVNPKWSRQKYGSREYIRIALAILSNRKTIPQITAKVGETIVTIDLGYLLPPEEEAFFKLYSWPTNFRTIGENFKRVTVPPVYRELKKHWECLGLVVKEIKA